MFINDLFNKKKLNESLRDGEYYTFKVFFDDGTDETLNFSSDDIDWDRVGAKRGKRVVDVKRQGGIQGSQTDTPKKPHEYSDDRGLARAQRAYDKQLPEGAEEDSKTHKYEVVVKGDKRSYSVWVEAKNEEVAIIRAQQYVAREHNDTAKRAAVVDVKQDVAEAIPYALSAANAAAEYRRQGAAGGGYRGRIDIPVQSREDYLAVGQMLLKAARAAGQRIDYGLSDGVMSIFSDSMTSDELDEFIDQVLNQGLAEDSSENKVSYNGEVIGHIATDSDGDPMGVVYDGDDRPYELYGYDDLDELKNAMMHVYTDRVERGVAEGQVNEVVVPPNLISGGLELLVDFLTRYPMAAGGLATAIGTYGVAKVVNKILNDRQALLKLEQDVKNWSIQKLHANKKESYKNGKKAIQIIRQEIEKRKNQDVAEGSLNEFDASDYKQRYTLYVGDAQNTYKVDTFSNLDAAIEEVEFLKDADPRTATSFWKVTDINGETVWESDPSDAYDAMRRGNKIQFRKPDEDVTEGADDLVGFSVDSERAYQAVMDRYGDMIEHHESGIMYAPRRIWGRIQELAYEADGIGAEEDNGRENPEHYGLTEEQLDELSKDTLKSYFLKRHAATKGQVGSNIKKSEKVVRQDLPRALKKLKDPEYGKQGVAEAGPFSYGAKPPRKGSVAYNAMMKRKEQERGRQPIEPRDQMVGTARVINLERPIQDLGAAFDDLLRTHDPEERKKYQQGVKQRIKTQRMAGPEGQLPESGVAEGSTREKLHKRHQELRTQSGLPNPDYYEKLKKSYDIENDQERLAAQTELKKRYGVKESTITNEDRERYLDEMRRAGYDIVTEAATLCPECGGPAYSDRMLAEKQDACYHKVKSRYKVWPSAYASGALVRCRKVGAKNWGNKSKK